MDASEKDTTKCHIKIGLFTLRACNRVAVGLCTKCKKSVCNKHQKLDPKTSSRLCIECFVSAQNAENKDNKSVHSTEYKRWVSGKNTHYDDWYYSVRSDYYGRYNYRPFNQGMFFTDNDYDSFKENPDSLSEDLKDDKGFFES